MTEITVIGGGLAGSEAAWQIAERGFDVKLYEMRPERKTGAHVSSDLAELVCSNSLGANQPDRASGMLISELRQLNSLLLRCAEATALPAGGALAVDRAAFSGKVTEQIMSHPKIRLIREEMRSIPAGPVVIASGPLTSPELTRSIQELTGQEHLFFFDAISPIVRVDTIDMTIAFRGSRYGKGQQEAGDYINCPLSQEEYDRFVEELIRAERIPLREFESEIDHGVKAGAHAFFEGCLPVETLAARGQQSLAFGPMRPVGLTDPRSGRRPAAVVQLRQDNLAGTLYNLVGFQTNLTYGEQKRILRMIPGLAKAEFVRYGQMHRNTFLASPLTLEPTLQFRDRHDLFFAGQITGVEGYMGNIATGLLAGLNAARLAEGMVPCVPPETSILGALVHYITAADLKDFQPMKANFGILPALETPIKHKHERYLEYVRRGAEDFARWMTQAGIAGQSQEAV